MAAIIRGGIEDDIDGGGDVVVGHVKRSDYVHICVVFVADDRSDRGDLVVGEFHAHLESGEFENAEIWGERKP